MPAADQLVERYLDVRACSAGLAARLSPEDQLIQSMPDCSPTKWHRAHTTWFFEEFVLAPRGIPWFDERYRRLFNSYYESVGPRHARPQRGLLARPDAQAIAEYQRSVDGRMVDLLLTVNPEELASLYPVLLLGLAHEEQHQELILTDILHAFSQNPLLPAYAPASPEERSAGAAVARKFERFAGGLAALGADGSGFAFDNELPRHRVFIEPYELATTLVSVAEVQSFIADAGYRTPSLWLSEGMEWVRAHAIEAPPYFRIEGGQVVLFGLEGERDAAPDEPVLFASYYEADAIARYLGARLPSEAEWEHAANGVAVDGHFLGGGLRPRPATRSGITQLWGTGWEWTTSSYQAYPGYVASAGALGEYNGKFMLNQQVLRGGSLFSPAGHLRATYRNFWPAGTRFQATAIRLARAA
jgi:ergothioneine biosynthesis protein EgtB